MANGTPRQWLSLGARNTPLQPAPRLGEALGFAAGCLWIKRDDLTALAGGGNKARKLEYLCADALAQDAKVLVTGGSDAQSNHVRAVAAAASQVGLRAVAVLPGQGDDEWEGNLLLDHLLGIEFVWIGAKPIGGMDQAIAEVADRLHEAGDAPYLVPLGGSSPCGALGYVEAAREIDATAPSGSIVYVAVGTGGTQAGLAVGFGDHSRVRGVNVGAPWDLRERVQTLAAETAHHASLPKPRNLAQVIDGFDGAGYGQPTPAGLEAMLLMGHHEGVVLDPVYTAKTFAALVADRRSGRLPADQATVFVHTGGLPWLLTAEFSHWINEGINES